MDLSDGDSTIVLPDGSRYNLAELSEDELLELYYKYEGDLTDHNDVVGTIFGGDFGTTLQSCLGPTTWQTMEMAGKLFSLCLILRLVTLFNVRDSIKHLVSSICGVCAFFLFFGEHSVLSHLFLLSSFGYCLLYLPQSKYKGASTSLVCVVYLLASELFVVGSETWNTIKGSMMIQCMKMISIAFDVEQGNVIDVPNIVEYCGFVLCPSSVIFGPFMMYKDYCQILKPRSINFSWLISLTRSVFLGYIFLIVSSCISPWIFPADSHKWLLAYQTALSFRCSNYFVGFLSETSCLLCGIGTIVKKDKEESVKWRVPVSRPQHVEFPRSFIEIAIHWSVPNHIFLKNYVFKRARTLGPFLAILLTFSASSILHGLSFQIAAVLLSIGTYAYIEHAFRKKLSRRLSMCIESRKCKPNCEHHYKDTNYWTTVLNLGFGFLNVFHLAYLGVMFDGNSSDDRGFGVEHTVGKWSHLNYLSPLVFLLMYLMQFIV